MDPVTGLPLAFGQQEADGPTAEEKLDRFRRADATLSVPPEQDQEQEDAEAYDLPISHEAVLKDHSKTVSALDVDPAGARICSGSYDYTCKLWDFGGMNAQFRPFRSWEPVPEGSYQVNDIKWSLTGDRLLIASATLQPKIYSREGEQLAIFPKGDMYLRDLKNTAGHVAEINQVLWHPKDDNQFLTASNDSTVRIWDATKMDKSKQVIVVKSKERGQRTHITAVAMSQDGKWIAAAGLDGCINCWNTSSNYVRPNYSVENAHQKNTVISGLTFALDNYTLLSRGNDGTLKIWDIRKMKQPLAVNSDLPNSNHETNAIFSPDENLVLTGTSGSAHMVGDKVVEGPSAVAGASVEGQLVIMRRSDLSVVRKIAVSKGSVVKISWHPRINQIIASTSLGTIHVFYSPETSVKGATMSVQRIPRKKGIDELESDLPTQGQIINPDALPMFRDDAHRRLLGKRDRGADLKGEGGRGEKETFGSSKGPKKVKTSDRHDPKKTMKPLPPMSGPGHGGRIGAAATQHIVQGLSFNRTRDEDPREALLKFAEKTKGDEEKWTKAWKTTQPETVFDQTEYDEEFDEDGKKIERPPAKQKDRLQGFSHPR